jgi:hypothetical protein
MVNDLFPGDVCSSHAARFLTVVVCSTMPPQANFVVKNQRCADGNADFAA